MSPVWRDEVTGEPIRARCRQCDYERVLDPEHWESQCPHCGSGDYELL